MTAFFLNRSLKRALHATRISVCGLTVFFGILLKDGFAQVSESSYGMRVRTRPQWETVVYEPVRVAPAPGNEATMIRRKNGSLTVFYINRPGEANKLMSISSTDGLQWTPPVKEFDLPGQAYYASRVLEDQQGVLHGIFHLWGTGNNGYRGKHLNVWYCQKPGDGKPWSQPRQLYEGYVGSIRSFIQLSTGRLLVSFAKAVPERLSKRADGEKDFGWNEIMATYSDDNGQHWQSSENSLRVEIDGTMPVRYGGVEPDVLELADRRLWMLIRTNKGHLYESYSADQGKTWQPAQPTRFISSDSPAELLRLSDNRLLLLLNGNQRWDNPHSYAAGGREVLHAAVSRDEGKTWRGFREVLTMPSAKLKATNDRGTAYASAVEMAGGKVALVAGQGETSSIVLFDPDWLDQTEAQDDFSAGLAQWTFYDADSLARIVPLTNQSRALQLTGTRANACAVWNFPATLQGTLKTVLELPADGSAVSMVLTDHFSVSADSLAAVHAVVRFSIKPGDFLETGQKPARISAEIRWNCETGDARLYLNNRLITQTRLQRRPEFGIDYLRIGTTENSGNFLVHSVKMTGKTGTN